MSPPTHPTPRVDTIPSKKVHFQDEQLLNSRPYLPKTNPKADKGPEAAKFDVGKLLGSSAPMTWGALLGTLPSNVVNDLVDQARKINEQQPTCSLEEASELAAVCSALSSEE